MGSLLFRRFIFVFALLAVVGGFAKSKPAFSEVWAYLLEGEESYLKNVNNITDLAYFSAKVNDEGRIERIPDIQKIPENLRKKRRMHCVVSAPWNSSLMYFCLSKDRDTMEKLIEDIVSIADFYDGVQIDFESVKNRETNVFAAFLKKLKEKLPEKTILSVALPARSAKIADAYDYKEISGIVDKVLIMAYDEHWGTGDPGNIASLSWCRRICSYAKENVPSDKLVMGIPLYGRVWQKPEHSRALKYFQTLDLWKQYSAPMVKRDEGGSPCFSYRETVDLLVYFEDVMSLKNKMQFYEDADVSSIGFWRISQEPALLWSSFKLHR